MPKLNKTTAKKVNESGSEFEPLPAGTYVLQLNKVEEKEGTAAKYWEWEFAVVSDDAGVEVGRKARVWDNTSLSEAALWRLKAMFGAFDVDVDTDTEDLLGEYCMGNIGIEIAEQGKNAGQPRNHLISTFPVPAEE